MGRRSPAGETLAAEGLPVVLAPEERLFVQVVAARATTERDLQVLRSVSAWFPHRAENDSGGMRQKSDRR